MQEQEVTTLNIPALALRGMTVFPKMTATVDVEREISIRALERAMEEMLDGLRTAGVDTMQAEEQINTILNMQEEAAFRAGFCEAFDLVLDTAHCASRGGL